MQTSFENMNFTLHQIMVMKRLLSFINRRINRIESTMIQNLTEYATLKQARDCYQENIYSGVKLNLN